MAGRLAWLALWLHFHSVISLGRIRRWTQKAPDSPGLGDVARQALSLNYFDVRLLPDATGSGGAVASGGILSWVTRNSPLGGEPDQRLPMSSTIIAPGASSIARNR